MLQKLTIQNYAIIDQLEINFSAKLNVITGETGAGKSIIAGALGLILGTRADTTALVNKEKKCVIEGTFSQTRQAIHEFLLRNELEPDNEIVLRREIQTSGKSRAFINDTPVNLSQMGEIGSLLVDLHQQFDSMELGESGFQRDVLDALAHNQSFLTEYREIFFKWKQLKQELIGLRLKKQQFEKEKDYYQFQYDELEEAGLKENELEEIEAELKLLSSGESIKTALEKAWYILEESDSPVIQQLKTVVNQLEPYSKLHSSLEEIIQRLESSRIEIQDIAEGLNDVNAKMQFDPRRMELLNDRLSLGYKLLKKHGVKTTAELLSIAVDLKMRLDAVLDIDESIDQKQAEADALEVKLGIISGKISEARKKEIKPFEQQVNKLLVKVGMPNARLKVSTREIEPGEYGIDQFEFLFNGNAASQQDEGYQLLRKVASGGERSRLMLCIKSLVAESMDLPVLVFDEIDSGISGEAAKQVGLIMKGLAENRQLICITHQPQIAGKGSAHFFVYKEIDGDRIKTFIRELNTEERITVIARMLSGEKPTAAAIQNAREMVMN